MRLNFVQGDPARPRGHALVYFHGAGGQVLATYLVVPPVAIEFGKYLPPMFAAQMPALSLAQTTAMPLPPLPEVVENLATLERLARLRDDDLIDGGTIDASQAEQLLYAASSVAQTYADLYGTHVARQPIEAAAAPVLPDLDVADVMLELMPDRERLGELARLTGQLRYAVEGGDPAGEAEAVAAMERVSHRLPPKYRAAELIAVARAPGPRGQRLADLYLQRAYKLVAEEFDALPALEAAIAAETSPPPTTP